MQGGLPNTSVTVTQCFPDSRTGGTLFDPSQPPDSVAPGILGFAPTNDCKKFFNGALASECCDGSFPNRGSLRVEQARPAHRAHSVPVELGAPRIFRRLGTNAANAINGAEHVRLSQLGGWAAELVPAARIDHEQAAIRVLHHVGRMKVAAARNQEVCILGRKRRPAGDELVCRNLAEIERSHEQRAPEPLAEHARVVAGKADRRRTTHVSHDGHVLARHGVVIGNAVLLAVDGAINGVNQSVPAPELRMLQERGCQEPLAFRREG